MKKRRGKQPVKPNTEEALKERLVYLKGLQGSTMNIPIIYRRTFDWKTDSVVFRPINKRSFVVTRPDLDEEEIDQSNYVVTELDVKELPYYANNRKTCEKADSPILEELRESLISFSLLDRYVHIDVRKTGDSGLDGCLMQDLEYLSTELGYSYSITKDAFRCTFVFPKFTNSQIVTRAMNTINGSIEAFRSLVNDILDLNISSLKIRVQEVGFMIKRAEVNLDLIYTDALNVHWDLPQMEPAGYFLQTQSIERAHDEMEYIINATKEALELLEKCPTDASKILFEELVSLWRGSIGRAIKGLELGLESVNMDKEGSMERALEMVRSYREEKTNRSSSQDDVIKELTQKIERLASTNAKKGGLKFLANVECLSVIEILFGINQSAARMSSITNVIATKTLYLKRTQ
jgi:hypothetical protein